jgi:hypothetical protein
MLRGRGSACPQATYGGKAEQMQSDKPECFLHKNPPFRWNLFFPIRQNVSRPRSPKTRIISSFGLSAWSKTHWMSGVMQRFGILAAG